MTKSASVPVGIHWSQAKWPHVVGMASSSTGTKLLGPSEDRDRILLIRSVSTVLSISVCRAVPLAGTVNETHAAIVVYGKSRFYGLPS